MDMKKNCKVAFITTTIPNYKVWIVEALGNSLGESFTAIHGPINLEGMTRDVGSDLRVHNNRIVKVGSFSIGSEHLLWISCLRWVWTEKPDVVILIDQVKIVSNYFVHLLMKLRAGRVLYYTQGYDHQAAHKQKGLVGKFVEWVRVRTLQSADAVIVYDQLGMEHLRGVGVSKPVYVATNTLDIQPILEFYDDIEQASAREEIVKKNQIVDGALVITFIGRLISDKHVGFMLNVIRRLYSENPGAVQAFIVGSGPEEDYLRKKAKGLPVSFTGYLSDEDMRGLLSVSDVVFLPGAVGLTIVEAFCAGKPLVTVMHEFHSPEICYLKDGENGIFLPDFDIESAAALFHRFIQDKPLLDRLSAGARRTAETDCRPELMHEAFRAAIEG